MASSELRSSFKFQSGDTRLVVLSQNEEIIAQVSSHAMSLASPVWKKFISPPWRPSQAGKAMVSSSSELDSVEGGSSHVEPLDFREDDADALLILLRIAHLDFVSVKKKLSIGELYNVAILCDKYDCVHLIKPWVEEWFTRTRSQIEGEVAKDVFISWSFGRKESFRMATTALLLQSRTDENGDLLDVKGQAIPEVMSPGIIG
jgi:hypothetical protein